MDLNRFVLGRRGSEDLPALRRRILKMISSELVDTSNLIDTNDHRYKELLESGKENIFNLSENHEEKTHIPIIYILVKK